MIVLMTALCVVSGDADERKPHIGSLRAGGAKHKHVRPNVSQFAAQWTQAQPITEPEKPKLKPRPRRRNRIPILKRRIAA